MPGFLIEYRDPRYSGTFLTEANGDTAQEAIENFVADNIDLFDENCDFEIIESRPIKAISRDVATSSTARHCLLSANTLSRIGS